MQYITKQKELLNLMFPKHKFHGNVCFGIKTNDGFRSMGYADINDLQEKIERFKFHSNSDYYITANTTKTGERTTDNLFSYNNIVIDIDCHDDTISQYTRECYIDELLCRIDRDIYQTGCVPQHNIAVKTGRGVQLWWCIEQTAKNLSWLFNAVTTTMIKHFQNFFNEYEMFDLYFNIDNASSKRAVGLYRLPYTYNTTTGTLVEAEIINYERYDINDLYNLIEDIKEEREETYRGFLEDKWKVLLEQRIDEIKNYTAIKSSQKIRTGYRNNYAWLYYNACYQVFGEDKANSMLDELNHSFLVPLDERQLRAIKKYICAKGGLKMKKGTFYSHLGEEPTYKSREMQRTEKRIAKKNRNRNIKKMYLSGISVKDICLKLHLAKNTVLKVLNIKHLKDERNKKIRELITQGFSIKKLSKKFGLSIRQIQRIVTGCICVANKKIQKINTLQNRKITLNEKAKKQRKESFCHEKYIKFLS